MITRMLSPPRAQSTLDQAPQEQFVQMLPTIQRVARFAFRRRQVAGQEELEELIAEVVANAWVRYSRLIERGRAELAYATVLAWLAVRQIRDGRRVGNTVNIGDVGSARWQRHKGARLSSLSDFVTGKWQELLLEDRRATPADLAVTRIDFAAWLRQLPRPKRTVAKILAAGEATVAAAKLFQVSPARISQLRRELQVSWEAFQGERLAPAT